MQRYSFRHDGLVFSYLDSQTQGQPLLALHGHWMGASDFEDLATRLSPKWRVIALDQRGFGETDHTTHHSMDAYIGDVTALLDILNIKTPLPILGHSFGSVVAYNFAAQHPERLCAMIIEDIGVEMEYDASALVRPWAGTYTLREDLEEKIGPRLSSYLQNSIRRVEEG